VPQVRTQSRQTGFSWLFSGLLLQRFAPLVAHSMVLPDLPTPRGGLQVTSEHYLSSLCSRLCLLYLVLFPRFLWDVGW
jgi:hypothetical protein